MKIAVVTENETTISQHFGRAPLYVVYNVADGKITGKEIRPKAGHHTGPAGAAGHDCHGETGHGCHGGEANGCHDGPAHGFDAGAPAKHAGMMANITDCQVLLAGGMGWGAYESLKSIGIEPVVTDVKVLDEAVKLYIAGQLPNLMERLH